MEAKQYIPNTALRGGVFFVHKKLYEYYFIILVQC